jgi:hypothetical protein
MDEADREFAMKIQRLIAAVVMLLAFMSLSSVAFAAGDYPPEVKGKVIHRHLPSDSVKPKRLICCAVHERVPGGPRLPFTGGDVVGITLLGLLAIGTGTVLVRRSRLREVPVENKIS